MAGGPPIPVNVVGPCGETYSFLPEYAGRLMQCPTCRRVYRLPNTESADFSPIQKFHMKKQGLVAEALELVQEPWQKSYTISQEVWSTIESYSIRETGAAEVLAVADRPRRLFNVFIYAFLVFALFALAIGVRLFPLKNLDGVFLVGALAVLITGLIALRFKFAKRHTYVFSDERRRQLLFTIRDLKQMEFPNARFRVEAPDGTLIGELIKPWIGDLFRSPWTLLGSTGNTLFIAREESVVLSFLRRIFLTKLWWFRTNFVLIDPASESVCGEYNRKLKLRDEYVLDLSMNSVECDVRLLLALGVLLDTAERR